MLGIAAMWGAVFAGSPKMSAMWKAGNMTFNHWACLFSAGTVGYWAGSFIGVNALGNPGAYRNHWMAYSYVKGCNRWEGRQILTKKPTY